MFKIAARNGLLTSLPFKDLVAAKLAYKFKDLQQFLDLYYNGCAVLLKEEVSHAGVVVPINLQTASG